LLIADIMRALARPCGDAGAQTLNIGEQAVAQLNIVRVTADSRRVVPGDLFAALPGAHLDGRNFIADAVARGAAAIMTSPGAVWPAGIPTRPIISAAEPRRCLARIAALLADPPPETVVAVTGTNGKTSTVEFIRQLWVSVPPNLPTNLPPPEQGEAAASLGTLGLIAPGFDPGPGLTTPDPVSLAETLAALARRGIRRVALEASSHGLDQFRLDGVRLAAGGFTNLTRDHLDYHGTLDAYRRAKLRLFEVLLPPGAPVVAHSEMEAGTLDALREIAARRRLDLSTVGESGSRLRLVRSDPLPDGQELTVTTGGRQRQVVLNLPGRFQADNVLVAAGLTEALGLSDVIDRLPLLRGVRGRMELAARLPNGAVAYVDYAHTPDALERLLTALRPHTNGRLHLVFGAGGDRDRGKRPLMGRAAARLADNVIVTDDNPRGEAPAVIRAAILAACPGAMEVGDRARAIEIALNSLSRGDVLVVAGKGHEQGQIIGGAVLPFDDAAIVRGLTAGCGAIA
jgi:UDP-N-acetylmuramoyl-L-alanyl-D-glutamate--2,6-diaminopimelate ligase